MSDIEQLAWEKMENLIPAIVQHALNGQVLMLGYMNREALEKTLQRGKVTFYSRSKQRLWTKGETSGNYLGLQSWHADCDNDAILLNALPQGPTCHLGTASCFGDEPTARGSILASLESIIESRSQNMDESSYTSKLLQKGVKRIAQKVGEEGVETALAACVNDQDELANESADLLYHLLVLLKASGLPANDVYEILRQRHQAMTQTEEE